MGEESRRLLIRGAKPRCDIPRGAKLGASMEMSGPGGIGHVHGQLIVFLSAGASPFQTEKPKQTSCVKPLIFARLCLEARSCLLTDLSKVREEGFRTYEGSEHALFQYFVQNKTGVETRSRELIRTGTRYETTVSTAPNARSEIHVRQSGSQINKTFNN